VVTYSLCEGIVCLKVEDGSSRLLDLGDRFYALSAVATRMLCAILDTDPEIAAEQLAQEYDMPLERIRTDLTSFIANLERKRLIRRTSDHRIAARRDGGIIWAAAVPIILGMRLIPGQRNKAWLLMGLAWLSCRLLGWPRTVEAWRTGCPRGPTLASKPDEVIRAIDAVVCLVAASHLVPAECKERALTAWALSRTAGVPAELIVGVRLFPLEGHCWCAYNHTVYSDDAERCAQFKPVWRYS
jgi:hypothetical protein